MNIFLDTADLNEIRLLASSGLIDGITTNPTLAAVAGKPFSALLKEICQIISGPVSAEVTALDAAGMIEQGERLAKIADNIVIKVPLTWDGLKACRYLTEREIMVNVTLCFSVSQALLAAKAGATLVSPFIGRLDDISESGTELIRDIRTMYDNYDYETLILAASIRHPHHVVECALAGADIVTLPPKIFRQLYKHPLTESGLDAFMQDWEKSGLAI